MNKTLKYLFLLVALFGLMACQTTTTQTMYILSFNSNGGTEVSSITEPGKTLIDKPKDPSRDNYVFKGWAINGLEVTWPYEINSNVTFTAIWEEKSHTEITYSVSFESNGGSAVPSQIVPSGDSLSIPTSPERNDFVFVGWYLDYDLSIPVEWPFLVSEDIMLYAKWTAAKLNLSIEEATLKWTNQSQLLTTICISGDYYTTNDSVFDIPQQYQDGNNHLIEVSVEGSYSFYSKSGYIFYQMTTDSMMNSVFDVKVDGNFLKWDWIGTEFSSNGFVIYVDGILEQEGYAPQFNLSSLTVDLFETKTFDIDIYTKSKEYYSDSTIVNYQYVYEVNDYEVTLKYRNSTNQIEVINSKNGLLDLPVPEYSGYQFNGWYLSNDGGTNLTTQWTSEKKVMDNLVLYASWVEAISSGSGGREVLSTPEVSVIENGFIWNAVPRAEGYEYRVKYSTQEEYSEWIRTNETSLLSQGTYTSMQIKAMGDGSITADSSITGRLWQKENFSIIGNVEIHYDIGVFFWNSQENHFVIELYDRQSSELLDSQTNDRPEYIISSSISAGDYKLVINGISRYVTYQMLAAPVIDNISVIENGLIIEWNNISEADWYVVMINDGLPKTVYSPSTKLEISTEELLDYESLNFSIKAECYETDILDSFVAIYHYNEMLQIDFDLGNESNLDARYIPKGSVLLYDLLPSPEKENHRFIGWYYTDSLLDKFTESITTENLTLYAKWENNDSVSYQLDFETNGGEVIDAMHLKLYEYVDLPIPSKEGFTFTGWYYDEYFNQLTDNRIFLDTDTTLFAKWIEGTWVFKEVSNGYEVISFTSNQSLVTIPSEYFGVSVISIAERALISNSNVKEIMVMNNITYIGPNAFGFDELIIYVHFTDKPYAWSKEWYNEVNQTVIWSCNGVLVEGDYEYILNSDEISLRISKYIGTAENVIVPSTVGNYSVTSIVANAFMNNSSIKTITIPSTIITIEQSSFYGMSNLVSITMPFVGESADATGKTAYFGYIFGPKEYPDSYSAMGYYLPNSLKEVTITNTSLIGKNAFWNAKTLTKIDISSEVTSIGENAFFGTSSLISITIPFITTSLGYYFSYYSFEGSYQANSYWLPNSLKEVIITNTTSIGNDAFIGAKSLTNIVLPSNLVSIGEKAFYNCSSLIEIEIPNTVTIIGSKAFCNCSSLLEIKVPNTVTTIEPSTFSGTSQLKKITLPFVGESRDARETNAVFGYVFGAFSYADSYYANGYYLPNSLVEVVITDATEISTSSFNDAKNIRRMSINNVMSIGEAAFFGMSNLEYLTIPYVGRSSMTSGSSSTKFGYVFGTTEYPGSYSANGFYLPSSLKTIVISKISNNYYQISESAFKGASGLTSIVIPSTMKIICADAFIDCDNLVIYIGRTTMPDQWDADWNSSNRPVYWSNEWHFDENYNPVPNEN